MSLKIKANKKTQLFSLAFAVVLCIIVFFVIIKLINAEEKVSNYYFYLSGFIVLFIYIFVLAIVGFINLLKSIFNKDAGLFIDESGIFNNLGIINTYKLQWKDIVKVEVVQTKKYNIRFMLIKLVDNNKYLERKNFIQKYFLNKRIKRKGTPVAIYEIAITYNLDELAKFISSVRSRTL